MLIGFILATCIVQGVAYYLVRKHSSRLLPFLILGIFIMAHWYLFPKLFIPKPVHGEFCGNPLLGIYLAFIMIGTGLSVVTHFIFPLIVPIKKNKMNK